MRNIGEYLSDHPNNYDITYGRDVDWEVVYNRFMVVWAWSQHQNDERFPHITNEYPWLSNAPPPKEVIKNAFSSPDRATSTREASRRLIFSRKDLSPMHDTLKEQIWAERPAWKLMAAESLLPINTKRCDTLGENRNRLALNKRILARRKEVQSTPMLAFMLKKGVL